MERGLVGRQEMPDAMEVAVTGKGKVEVDSLIN